MKYFHFTFRSTQVFFLSSYCSFIVSTQVIHCQQSNQYYDCCPGLEIQRKRSLSLPQRFRQCKQTVTNIRFPDFALFKYCVCISFSRAPATRFQTRDVFDACFFQLIIKQFAWWQYRAKSKSVTEFGWCPNCTQLEIHSCQGKRPSLLSGILNFLLYLDCFCQ